ncbi:MAG: hypothetical protein IJ590_01325 [Rickettsiales bacterium]|nr:hypothetical protein [Rickettsiales bacterium]
MSLKKENSNKNKRSPLGQAWHIGTHPFKMLGKLSKLALPAYTMISNLNGARGFYKKDNGIYSQDGELIRQGNFDRSGYNFINPEIIDHKDVVKFDIDIAPTSGENTWCNVEKNRYHPESMSGYCLNDDSSGRPPFPKNLPNATVGTKIRKNGIDHMELSEENRKYIIESAKNNFDKLLQNIKDKKDINVLNIDLSMHREPDNEYYISNVTPEDFKDIFEKAMQSGYNKLYISEISCFNNKELLETLTNVAKNNGYCGDIIIKRNSKYDKKLEMTSEFFRDKINKIFYKPEFVHIKDGKINCISENDARKILGGSYLDNLKYNEAHSLDDNVPNKERCRKFMKHFQYEGQCKVHKKNDCTCTSKNTCNAKNCFLCGDVD